MPNDSVNILLAEDNPADVFLVREAIRQHGLAVSLHVMWDGEMAIEFIESAEQNHDSPCPAIALLDLNLPKVNGLEVLARLRRSTKFGNIPVAIISSAQSPGEARALAQLRADHYFAKPSNYRQFMVLGEIVKNLLQR